MLAHEDHAVQEFLQSVRHTLEWSTIAPEQRNTLQKLMEEVATLAMKINAS